MSVLGATIGGEPGGRLPVVVDDLPESVPVADAETSIAIPLGAAEPGRDIFAQEEVKEAKSVPPSSNIVPPEEDKRVVSVVSVGGNVHIVQEASSDGASQSPVPAAAEQQQTSVSPEPANESGVPGEQEGRQKPEGPLDQAEALANEAAQELYPGENSAL